MMSYSNPQFLEKGGLSEINLSFQPQWRQLFLGCALSLSIVGSATLPIMSVNAQPQTPPYQEMPLLQEGKADIGGGRYLVKMKKATPVLQSDRVGIPPINYEAQLADVLKSYPDTQVQLLLDPKIFDLKDKEKLGLSRTYVVEIGTSTNPEEVIAKLSSNPNVEYVEEDGLVWANAIYPNDPYFNSQWGLHNTGQTGGTNDKDIDAPEAWGMSIGSKDTIIAIVDTGIDYKYQNDLKGKVLPGYDFTNNDTDPMDGYGHGTHVSGIAAAITNNGIQMAGVCWECSLLPVQVLTSGGWGYWEWLAQGIIYAADHGAKVVNMSLGGSGYSQVVYDAVRYAYGKGVTLVAAAGNSGCYWPYWWYSTVGYPAKFNEVIAVSAIDHYGNRAYFSSCGPEVDVAAPGYSVLSILPYNNYAWWSGTSMASPHVAGAVGALLSLNPTLTPAKVQQCIADSADYSGDSWFYGRGRLNFDILLSKCGCTIKGTTGNDMLWGTPGNDVICGLAGDDWIFGVEGNDIVLGGDGNDVLYGDEGKDTVLGGNGDDLIWGGPNDDYLKGDNGYDSIDGDEGVDTCEGEMTNTCEK